MANTATVVVSAILTVQHNYFPPKLKTSQNGECQPKSKTEQITRGYKPKSKADQNYERPRVTETEELSICLVNQITYKDSEQKTKKLHSRTLHTNPYSFKKVSN